jgi:hypothetical protein
MKVADPMPNETVPTPSSTTVSQPDARYCASCGRRATLWMRLSQRDRCSSCRASDQAGLENRRAVFLGVLTALEPLTPVTERQQLVLAGTSPRDVGDGWHRRYSMSALRYMIDACLADERLTEPEEEWLRGVAGLLGVDLDRIARDDRSLFDHMALARVADGRMPNVRSGGIALGRREVCHLASDAELIARGPEGTAPRGGSPVWRGVPLRFDDVSKIAVRLPANARALDRGTIAVTSRRIVFRGKRGVIEIQHGTIAGFTLFADGLRVDGLEHAETYAFRVRRPYLVAGIADAAGAHGRRRRPPGH